MLDTMVMFLFTSIYRFIRFLNHVPFQGLRELVFVSSSHRVRCTLDGSLVNHRATHTDKQSFMLTPIVTI